MSLFEEMQEHLIYHVWDTSYDPGTRSPFLETDLLAVKPSDMSEIVARRAVEALIRRGLLEGIESPDLVFEISTAGIEYVEAQLGNRESEVSQYGEMLSRSEVDQSAKSSQKGTDVGRLPSTTQADLAEDKILARAVRFYEAEELKHRFGNEVRDRAATNGRAWLADLSHVKNHFVYGPYEPLDDLGPYAAWFKVKVSDNSSQANLLSMDVCGPTEASKFIRASDF